MTQYSYAHFVRVTLTTFYTPWVAFLPWLWVSYSVCWNGCVTA